MTDRAEIEEAQAEQWNWSQNESQVHELPMGTGENVSLGVTSGDQSRHS